MTEISPSSTKVDDFLSSLSQISQERIREDQQRQNSLRRNINDLKSNSNTSTPLKPTKPAKYSFTPATYKIDKSSTALKEPFRSSRYDFNDENQDDEASAPKLPTRPSQNEENPPPLPTRKAAASDNSFDIDLFQPKARKDPVRPNKPTYKTFNSPTTSNTNEGGFRSFSQIENSIKNSTSISSEHKPQQTKKAPPPKPTKPKTPTKPVVNDEDKRDWMSSLSNSKAVSPTIKHSFPKPSYQSALWATQNAKINSKLKDEDKMKPAVIAKPSYLDHKRKSIDDDGEEQPPLKPQRPNTATFIPAASSSSNKAPPPKPLKLSAATYEQKDSELLKSTILKLSSSSSTSKVPPLKPSKPSIEQYTQSEKNLLHSAKSSLSSTATSSASKVAPLKPVKPSLSKYAEQDTFELQNQLQRLKSTKPQISNHVSSHTEKSSLPPPVYRHEGRSTSSLTPSKPESFEDKLSSILRASTFPEVKSSSNSATNSNPIPTINARANTDEIKTKKQDTTNTKGMTHLSKSRAKGPKRKLPKNMQTSSKEQDQAQQQEQLQPPQIPSLVIRKATKAPPPINKTSKPKSIADLKPSRNISGEIFI